MYVNMDNYKKEDIRDEYKKGIVVGYENAIEDLDSAVFNYIDELDLPSETMKEIISQSVRHFAKYAKGYLSDQRDMFVVASIDGQLE